MLINEEDRRLLLHPSPKSLTVLKERQPTDMKLLQAAKEVKKERCRWSLNNQVVWKVSRQESNPFQIRARTPMLLAPENTSTEAYKLERTFVYPAMCQKQREESTGRIEDHLLYLTKSEGGLGNPVWKQNKANQRRAEGQSGAC